jgi:hypothetical protein
MPTTIDTEGMVVRAGGQTYPFAPDPATGGVTLALPDDPVVVRPLTWAERVRLARFAELGLSGLQSALVELATGRDLDGTEAQAAAQLAAWLDRPQGGGLDEAELAAQALGLSRATGWSLAEIDARPAREIDAFLRHVGVQPTHEAPVTRARADPPPGFTRIDVLPDPAEAAPPLGTDAVQRSATTDTTEPSANRATTGQGPGGHPSAGPTTSADTPHGVTEIDATQSEPERGATSTKTSDRTEPGIQETARSAAPPAPATPAARRKPVFRVVPVTPETMAAPAPDRPTTASPDRKTEPPQVPQPVAAYPDTPSATTAAPPSEAGRRQFAPTSPGPAFGAVAGNAHFPDAHLSPPRYDTWQRGTATAVPAAFEAPTTFAQQGQTARPVSPLPDRAPPAFDTTPLVETAVPPADPVAEVIDALDRAFEETARDLGLLEER